MDWVTLRNVFVSWSFVHRFFQSCKCQIKLSAVGVQAMPLVGPCLIQISVHYIGSHYIISCCIVSNYVGSRFTFHIATFHIASVRVSASRVICCMCYIVCADTLFMVPVFCRFLCQSFRPRLQPPRPRPANQGPVSLRLRSSLRRLQLLPRPLQLICWEA